MAETAQRVTCETCGELTWGERLPCCNCDTAPPVSNWSAGFTFDQALRGLRLGKRVRRKGWNAHVEMRADPEHLEMVGLRGTCTYHASSEELLADDWEVA